VHVTIAPQAGEIPTLGPDPTCSNLHSMDSQIPRTEVLQGGLQIEVGDNKVENGFVKLARSIAAKVLPKKNKCDDRRRELEKDAKPLFMKKELADYIQFLSTFLGRLDEPGMQGKLAAFEISELEAKIGEAKKVGEPGNKIANGPSVLWKCCDFFGCACLFTKMFPKEDEFKIAKKDLEKFATSLVAKTEMTGFYYPLWSSSDGKLRPFPHKTIFQQLFALFESDDGDDRAFWRRAMFWPKTIYGNDASGWVLRKSNCKWAFVPNLGKDVDPTFMSDSLKNPPTSGWKPTPSVISTDMISVFSPLGWFLSAVYSCLCAWTSTSNAPSTGVPKREEANEFDMQNPGVPCAELNERQLQRAASEVELAERPSRWSALSLESSD